MGECVKTRLETYWTRLEMYRDPAGFVSKTRLGAYQAPCSIFPSVRLIIVLSSTGVL